MCYKYNTIENKGRKLLLVDTTLHVALINNF